MIRLIVGTNRYRVQEELNKQLESLSEDSEVLSVHAEQVDIQELPQLLGGMSLFSADRTVVIKEASSIKPLWERLGDVLPSLDAGVNLILVEHQPDKRTKTYKWLQKSAEVSALADLDERRMVQWLQAEARRLGANIEPETARFLIHYLGTDQTLLASEVAKLALAGSPITRELIEIHSEATPQASAFEVIDAALAGRGKDVRNQLASMRALEDPYRFFGLLASQASVLTACVFGEGRTSQQIAKECGVHPFVAQKTMPRARSMGRDGARRMNEYLATCDMSIKTSRGEPWQLIELTLMKISTSR